MKNEIKWWTLPVWSLWNFEVVCIVICGARVLWGFLQEYFRISHPSIFISCCFCNFMSEAQPLCPVMIQFICSQSVPLISMYFNIILPTGFFHKVIYLSQSCSYTYKLRKVQRCHTQKVVAVWLHNVFEITASIWCNPFPACLPRSSKIWVQCLYRNNVCSSM